MCALDVTIPCKVVTDQETFELGQPITLMNQ
uniref:Uncharacterized protein n=1 Tax=Rhizophora mucronata TaxID=61149 RepID=A0A2P2N4G9_RHIMU